MPGPDQTLARDAMLTRMEMATAGGPLFRNPDPSHTVVLPHDELKRMGLFAPVSGELLKAVNRTLSTRQVVEAALLPFTNIRASEGATADSQWRAATHFRPLQAIEAVSAAIDRRPVTDAMVEAAGAKLPGVTRRAVKAAIGAALAVQRREG